MQTRRNKGERERGTIWVAVLGEEGHNTELQLRKCEGKTKMTKKRTDQTFAEPRISSLGKSPAGFSRKGQQYSQGG